MKKLLVALVAASTLVFAPSFALAQAKDYPNGPIRFVVPNPAGGALDILARMLSDKLQKNEGWKAIVENRAGGNTVIGMENVARSAPDGLTVGFLNAPFVINPTLMGKLPYDTLKDFTPVSVLVRSPLLMVSAPSLPWTDLTGYLKAAKANPDYAAVGVAGSGSLPHIALEVVNAQAGTKLRVIPYKGAGPAMNDGLGGQVPVLFLSMGDVMGHIGSGRLRPLAVATRERVPQMPNAGTFIEQGVPFEMATWYGMAVPAGTPKDIVAKLHAAVARAMAEPEMKEWASKAGFIPVVTSPDEAATIVKADIERYGKVIRDNNIKPE